MDDDCWNAITELLTAQSDPVDIIGMSSDINQFTIRCSQIWLGKHEERALSFLQEVSASVILVLHISGGSITFMSHVGDESSGCGGEEDGP